MNNYKKNGTPNEVKCQNLRLKHYTRVDWTYTWALHAIQRCHRGLFWSSNIGIVIIKNGWLTLQINIDTQNSQF